MTELINVSAAMGMATSRQTLLDGATVRNIFTGHSGYMGLMAAQLVECGFTGERDSPASVYGKVLADGFDAAKAIENLGSEWILAQGYFKLHLTGRYVHSAIDALEDLLARSGELDISRTERIEVKAYRLAAMLAEKRVTSSLARVFPFLSRSPPSSITAARSSARSSRPRSTTRRSRRSPRACTCRKSRAIPRATPPSRCAICASSCRTERCSKGAAPSRRASLEAASPRRAAREIHAARRADLGRDGRTAPARRVHAARRAARSIPLRGEV